MAKVDANKALNVGKDGYQKGGINIETPSQNLEIDPRSKLDNWNLIPTGDKVEVKGTKRMLKSKSKTATWY
tara:strand:+ start:387 stop:599 length:213 start_codon:yes stop_codon:yes gene_type:complete